MLILSISILHACVLLQLFFDFIILVPRIDSSTTISEDIETIIISYSLKHTGGYDRENVSVGAVCGLTNSLSLPTMSKSSGSGDSNTYSFDDNYVECMSNCLDGNLGGTLEVNGLLTAGYSYICVVVAGNEEGEFYYNTTSLIATIGLLNISVYLIPRFMIPIILL